MKKADINGVLENSQVEIQKINYSGWENCYILSNGAVELIVTTDIGPRVIKFGFVNDRNEFNEVPEHLGLTQGQEWRSYGGHRLWHSPEDKARTYVPDNFRVDSKILEDGRFRVSQPKEELTGIQKEIDIKLSVDSASVKVVHRLINRNVWQIELSAWALSVMSPGGRAIIPLPPKRSHAENLLPSIPLVLWTYTDLSDDRLIWGNKYIMLKQAAGKNSPQKIGAAVKNNWIAYYNNNHLFVKTVEFLEDRKYPDLGCSAEIFTNNIMLELETLSPLTRLEPNSSIEHVEKWFLFNNVPLPRNDNEIDEYIIPLINSILL